MAQETNVIIQPVLHYRDPGNALLFLTEVFGFREHSVSKDADGKIAYVELEFGGCYFGFGPTSTEDSPFNLGPTCVYVGLDDPDDHHKRAVAAGAENHHGPHRPGLRLTRIRGPRSGRKHLVLRHVPARIILTVPASGS